MSVLTPLCSRLLLSVYNIKNNEISSTGSFSTDRAIRGLRSECNAGYGEVERRLCQRFIFEIFTVLRHDARDASSAKCSHTVSGTAKVTNPHT